MKSGSAAASAGRKRALGAGQVKRTRVASRISTTGGWPSTSSSGGRPRGESSGWLATSSHQKRTSAVVKGWPSDQRCPWRSVSVKRRASDRKSVVSGKKVAVCVELGGPRIIKKK